ncbi:MAG TPA: glycosyltransferase family A protein [Bacteroidales bacterium]|nr:glycosyltransferase family A protein [Bacteroidales bacterium]
MPINAPKISIVTACYNHGKYIHEMIQSVMNQTLQDFEIIIVNDGSTDDTGEILDKIDNDKIRIVHTGNYGPSHARNLAIGLAKSDIILNLDADDKIGKDLLEKAYNVFNTRPEAGIVYTNCRYFGASVKKLKFRPFKLKRMLISNQIISAAFFRKCDWKKCGGYSEDFIYGLEDWDLWLSILERGRDAIEIPDSWFYYRTYKRPGESRSGRRNCNRSKALRSILLIYNRHIELYSRYPEIKKRIILYEFENAYTLIKIFRNLIYPVRYKLSHLI